MRLRLTKIDEYQLLTCLKRGLWGSQSARFKTWREGDGLAIIVDKSLAALAEVTGSAFVSKDRVWDNGLFPHRIHLKFTHVLKPEDRPPILGEVRDALTQEWGPRYGWAILNQRVLESSQADAVVKAITSKPNNLSDYQQNLSYKLEEARVKREQLAKEKPRKVKKGPLAPIQLELTDERPKSKRDASAHTKTQSELIALGRTTGCSVWIASNDKGRSYRQSPRGSRQGVLIHDLTINVAHKFRIGCIEHPSPLQPAAKSSKPFSTKCLTTPQGSDRDAYL